MRAHGSIACLLTFGIALFAPHAGAQENLEESTQPDTLSKAVLSQIVVPPSPKSESAALLISLACTAVPITVGLLSDVQSPANVQSLSDSPLIVGGFVFGPATGHFYAGQRGRAWYGVALRAISVGVILETLDPRVEDPEDQGRRDAALVLGIVSALMDIAATASSARTYNEAHGAPRAAVGVYVPDGGDGVGATVQVTF